MELLSWAIIVAIAFGFLTLAYNALQTIASAEDFLIVKMWVGFAALTVLIRLIVWGVQTNRSLGVRIAGCLVLCGGVLYGTIEAVRYVDRRHARWLAQQQSAVQSAKSETPPKPTSRKSEEKERPNLIDRGVRVHRAHQDIWASVLVDGASDNRYGGFDPDWQLLTIEICNEFRVSPKTAPVENVTAEVTYTFPDGTNFKMNRGAWLSGRNRMGFNVNDYQHLIILGSLMRTPGQARIFIREYPQTTRNGYINLDALMGDLPHNQDYSIEIKLISESEGEHYATFNYMLSVADEGQGPISIDLVEPSEWEAFKKDRAEETIKAQEGDA